MLYLVTNCDDGYFKYLIPLLKSAINNIKIPYNMICGLIDSCRENEVKQIFAELPHNLKIVHHNVPHGVDARSYYANSKLMLLEKTLREYPDGDMFLYLDTDSLVLKDIRELIEGYGAYDLTIFDKSKDPITTLSYNKLCNSSKFSTRYCSGTLLIKNSSVMRDFMARVILRLDHYGIGKWFSDQRSLHKVIENKGPIQVGQLPMTFIDFTCSAESHIITGKGQLKNLFLSVKDSSIHR